MFELYREDRTGMETKPFATVRTPGHAEETALDELMNGDAEIVKVKDIGYLAMADLDFACTHCGSHPCNPGAGSMVWYRGNDTRTPYCSYECVMTAPVKTLTTEQVIRLAREAVQNVVDCGGEPEHSAEDGLSFTLQMWLEDDQIDDDIEMTSEQKALYLDLFRQFRAEVPGTADTCADCDAPWEVQYDGANLCHKHRDERVAKAEASR